MDGYRGDVTSTRFTIDELARAAATKVSTIRLYQQRGLLPPPVIEGRVGVYDDTHLALGCG